MPEAPTRVDAQIFARLVSDENRTTSHSRLQPRKQTVTKKTETIWRRHPILTWEAFLQGLFLRLVIVNHKASRGDVVPREVESLLQTSVVFPLNQEKSNAHVADVCPHRDEEQWEVNAGHTMRGIEQ